MHCPPCSVVYVVKLVPAENMPSDKINLTHFQSKSRPTARKQPLSEALPVSPDRLRIRVICTPEVFPMDRMEVGQFIRSSDCKEVGQQIRDFIR